MTFSERVSQLFLRNLLSTPAGREHMLNLMVAAEEGDETGVFDQLERKADDEELARLIRRHKEDEQLHASLFRECLHRNGYQATAVPDELMIIRRIAREAGDGFAEGERRGTAAGITSRSDVMTTYALLLAIERRGVERFPQIGAEFRRLGDHQTADTFDRVARDELRHTRYCLAIGRRYAPDDLSFQRAIAHYQRVEARAFLAVGLAGIAYAQEQGLVFPGPFGRALATVLRAIA